MPKASTTEIIGADTYDFESTDEDISFAIFCLLKDLTDIRHYVRQTVSTTQKLILPIVQPCWDLLQAGLRILVYISSPGFEVASKSIQGWEIAMYQNTR